MILNSHLASFFCFFFLGRICFHPSSLRVRVSNWGWDEKKRRETKNNECSISVRFDCVVLNRIGLSSQTFSSLSSFE